MAVASDCWEVVHTEHDHWDGPLVGAADLGGVPHAYSRIFDEARDAWSDEFWLSPISFDQFLLLKEDWARWRRWLAAHLAQALGPDDAHPVLAADRPRYQEVRQLVTQALSVDRTRAVRMKGEFRTARGADQLEVRWTRTR